MQIDSSSTSSEISFHGLPSKSKRPSIRKQIASSLSSQLIVSLFLRNSHLQRDIQQTCFCQYFCELLENSWSASKKHENFQKVHKKHPWRSLILVKLQAFTEAATEGVPKKNFLRKVFAEFTEKHLCQGLYLNQVRPKAVNKETLVQVFPREFCKISKNTFLTEHLRTTLSVFSFSEAATGGVL